MASEDQNQADRFWKEKEELLGGNIVFQTFATLVGEAASETENGRGGLCYIVNDRFYFEDFEKQNALMALFGRKDADYEKTEMSFPLEEVTVLQKVAEKDAKACIAGLQKENEILTLKGLKSLFSRGYWRFEFRDRASLFFEIMEEKKLFKHFPEARIDGI